MRENNLNFIVIDDSKLDCFIAEKIIRNAGVDAVRSFTDARQVVELIKNDALNVTGQTILIVDIQMPLMNGFEFIEAFEKLPQQLQDKYDVYVLSSSTNDNDINRIKAHRSVKRYLNKPLTLNTLSSILAPGK
jgi:CheY-like chemotaxis protein